MTGYNLNLLIFFLIENIENLTFMYKLIITIFIIKEKLNKIGINPHNNNLIATNSYNSIRIPYELVLNEFDNVLYLTGLI